MRLMTLALLLCCGCSKGNGTSNGNGNRVQEPRLDIDTWHCVFLENSTGTEQNHPCYEKLDTCTETRYRAISNGGKAGECERYTSAYCLHVTDLARTTTELKCSRTATFCAEWRDFFLSNAAEVSDCVRIPPP